MDQEQQPELLAVVAGRALYRQGAQIWLMESGGGWIPTATFVLALIVVIVGVNGVLQIVLVLGGDGILGLGLGAIAVAALAGFALVKVRRLARRKRGFAASAPVLVFDLQSGQLRDRDGAPIAPLNQLRVHTALQLTSSSRQLKLSWPEGSVCIARGSPFAGDVSAFTEILGGVGIRVG